jgi:hypothetical protein
MLTVYVMCSNELILLNFRNSCILLDPMLGNDLKISNYETADTRQRPVNHNREKVFSTR